MDGTYDPNIVEAQWSHMKTQFLRVMQVPAFGEVYRLRVIRMMKILSHFANDLVFMVKDCTVWEEIDNALNIPREKASSLIKMRIHAVYTYAMDAIRVLHNVHDQLTRALIGNPNLVVVVSRRGSMAHKCGFKGSPIYVSFVRREVTHS